MPSAGLMFEVHFSIKRRSFASLMWVENWGSETLTQLLPIRSASIIRNLHQTDDNQERSDTRHRIMAGQQKQYLGSSNSLWSISWMGTGRLMEALRAVLTTIRPLVHPSTSNYLITPWFKSPANHSPRTKSMKPYLYDEDDFKETVYTFVPERTRDSARLVASVSLFRSSDQRHS
jgi:hypothetical protein